MTPAFSASGSTSSRPSSTVARASSRVCPLAGPETMTSTGAPSIAASSMATAIVRDAFAPLFRRRCGKPSSATQARDAQAFPANHRRRLLRRRRRVYAATPPMYGTPLCEQLRTTCSSDHGSAVIWLKLRRSADSCDTCQQQKAPHSQHRQFRVAQHASLIRQHEQLAQMRNGPRALQAANHAESATEIHSGTPETQLPAL